MTGALVLTGLIMYPRFKRIEHPKPGTSSDVVFHVDLSPDEVVSLLLKTFQHNKTVAAPFDRFNAYSYQDGVFPQDYRNNPFDIFLYEPTGDVYWPSEYLYNGKKADFRCSFILHQSSANGGSQIQIFEYQPQIRAGNYFDPLGHAGPGMYWDIRPVEPTVIDREILKSILFSNLISH